MSVIGDVLFDSMKWHVLPKEIQARFYEMARHERDQHMLLYPNWSAKDNYARHKQTKRGSKKMAVADSSKLQGKVKEQCQLKKNKICERGSNVWPCKLVSVCLSILSTAPKGPFINDVTLIWTKMNPLPLCHAKMTILPTLLYTVSKKYLPPPPTGVISFMNAP